MATTVATIGGHGIGKINLKAWFRNKTINRVAVMALHAFIPYEVKPGSKTAKKRDKAIKILNFFKKISPMNGPTTEKFIKDRIAERINKRPEDAFKEMVDAKINGHGIGLVGVTIASITGLVVAIGGVLIPIVNSMAGTKQTDEDRIPNPSELASDVVGLSRNVTVDAPTTTPPTTTPPTGGTLSAGAMVGIAIGTGVLIYLLTQKDK